ncbi:hypothetical protein Nepgr_022437 [Nepenthes gracilis]|uniref:Uncharacterized protein n=1 Tax=Nepenthes gracilis TaxID=150966 RepID=A0AAD3XYE5_NEPGR|nr:hypothetical protein Nepgr_022437 [Nepenthes gracilis]
MAFSSSSENLSAAAAAAAATAAATGTSATSASAVSTPTSTANTIVTVAITAATARPLVVPQQQAQRQPRPPSSQFLLQQQRHHHLHPQFTSQHSVFASQTHQTFSSRPQLTRSPAAQEGIRYPVASSGRGLTPRAVSRPQFSDNAVTVANPGAYPPPPRSMMAAYPSPAPHLLTYVRSPPSQSIHLSRPPNLPPSNTVSLSVPPTTVKGTPFSVHPQSKVAPPQGSVSDCNGHKEPSDKCRDDTFVIVRDRKVRISHDASIYALCRSWLRNGHLEESQPQFCDAVKCLPKPSPAPMSDTHSPKRKETDEEEEEDNEDEKSVEHLSTEELLYTHIRHAKRVRARLREDRLLRIDRYKSRLALLLPPLEQCRTDASAGT